MRTYTFKKERDLKNEYDISEVTMKIEAGTLNELIEEFGRFLVASGFSAEGVRKALDTEEI
jgi:hypothetical protein